jgi:tubulin---tyrosine ligase
MAARPAQTLVAAVDTPNPEDKIYAVVAYEDPYVQPLIVSALESLFPPGTITILDQGQDSSGATAETPSLAKLLPKQGAKVMQITQYEGIDFEYAMGHAKTCLINSYIIRKALIRKHYLSATVDNWVAKNPSSVLKTHVKRSEAFEVDYAEFLDDALVEAWDLKASMERNSGRSSGYGNGDDIKENSSSQVEEAQGQGGETGDLDGQEETERGPESREWWILKPGMSDRGQGIRLFSTMEELQAIFDGWEEEMPDSDDEDGDEDAAEADDENPENQKTVSDEGDPQPPERIEASDPDYITTSHLRHFIAQPYIHPPLLLAGSNRKFHIRTYVLCVGSLKVYVNREMLALFAGKAYSPPWESSTDLDAHLTNTCLQESKVEAAATATAESVDPSSPPAAIMGSVRRFWDVAWDMETLTRLNANDDGGDSTKPSSVGERIFSQICDITGEIFEAAARGMTIHFQPLGNAFEVYGLDFLVDAEGSAWLLEVNAFPDFRQTGGELREVVAEFWRGVLRLSVEEFFGIAPAPFSRTAGADRDGLAETKPDLVLVREVDLGRR